MNVLHLSNLFLWSVVLIILILLIHIYRLFLTLSRSRHLAVMLAEHAAFRDHHIVPVKHPTRKLVLFLHFSQKNNEEYILNVQKMFPETERYIYFIGTEWQANLLKKRANGDYTIWLDGGSNLPEKLGIVDFPSYIVLDRSNKIIETKLMDRSKSIHSKRVLEVGNE